MTASPGPAMQGLNDLLKARAQLEQRLADVDVAQREATAERDQASDQLAQLEARAAAGEPVSAAERTKAERRLVEARVRWGEPWQERAAGARRALTENERETATYVGDRLDDLLGEMSAEGEAAAEAVTRAAARLVDAYTERMRIEERVTWLAAKVRPPRPGDVQRTRAEPLLREATSFLEAGGEAAPTLLVDPRKPRHETAAEQPAA